MVEFRSEGRPWLRRSALKGSNAQADERPNTRFRGLRRGPKQADLRGQSFYRHDPGTEESEPKVSDPYRLRAVTYNIHKGIGGLDRRYRIERVIDVLKRINADVCFLQEVDEGVPRSRKQSQAQVIGEGLGLPYQLFGPNVRLREGHYGNAILSRYPFDHHENIDLTIAPKKRRAALHARFTLPLPRKRRRRMWLFNVHLGLSGLERRMQLRYLLDWIKFRHPREETGIVLGGDFNDVFARLGSLLMIPAGFRSTNRTLLTFPAGRPLRPLDRIYLRGPLTPGRFHRPRGELVRQASDHVPLICDFRLR